MPVIILFLLYAASSSFVSADDHGSVTNRLTTHTTEGSERGGEAAGPRLAVVAVQEPSVESAENLSGAAIMSDINPVADADPSDCRTGSFADEAAINRAACPAGGKDQVVVWDSYDEAYAAAPEIFPTSYLDLPTGCVFGCVPLPRTNVSGLQRIASTMPWRGKCFKAEVPGDMMDIPTVRGPTA